MNQTLSMKKHPPRLSGTVVSVKMQKTIVVRVDRTLVHPKYGKRYLRSRRYKVHDPEGKGREGDAVTIEACRPLSKEKRWRLLSPRTRT
jgi:small subunit ribosomal protein S17